MQALDLNVKNRLRIMLDLCVMAYVPSVYRIRPERNVRQYPDTATPPARNRGGQCHVVLLYPRAGSRRAVIPEGNVMKRELEFDPLLTPSEAGSMFGVDPKTVTKWAKAGKLTPVWTLGGHRRYREAEVRGLLAAGERGGPAAEPACLGDPAEQAA